MVSVNLNSSILWLAIFFRNVVLNLVLCLRLVKKTDSFIYLKLKKWIFGDGTLPLNLALDRPFESQFQFLNWDTCFADSQSFVLKKH